MTGKGSPRRRRKRSKGVRWPILAYIPAVVALAAVRRRVGLPRPVMIALASAAPLAVVVALPSSRWRSAAVWATYLWLFKVAHQAPFDEPDKIKQRVRVRQSVRLDSVIGAGAPLALRLQRALRDPPRLTLLDWTLSALYSAFWLPPSLLLMWVLLHDEKEFPRLAARLAAGYHLTTVGYWIRPTAPPWWASEIEGEMGGGVQRVTREVSHAARAGLRGEPRRQGEQGDWREHGNPWASMPSDHFVGAATEAQRLAGPGQIAGAQGVAYLLAKGYLVQYLRVHYVIDHAAALALAEAVRRADPLLQALARGLPVAARAHSAVAARSSILPAFARTS
ncbi:MAG: phosphatase PAP2 family protein [Actinobacteria bacterium]|nr:phosphatase PAP2 family protein [Actinomycetota bacterium]